jgi:hypothetical protein
MLTQAREPFKTFLYIYIYIHRYRYVTCVISRNYIYIVSTRASDPHKQCETQFTRDWTVRRLEWSARFIIIIIVLRQVFAHTTVRSVLIYIYYNMHTASPTTVVAFTFARGHCRRVARIPTTTHDCCSCGAFAFTPSVEGGRQKQ